MSFKRELLVSFGVQGAGAASVLLATLWLGASLGPEVQGGFSRAKSEVEFVGALAMFGLPQALFFHVHAGRLSARAALRWVGASTLLALPIGALYGLVQHTRDDAVLLIALALAIAASVAHGELRGLLLVRSRAYGFNLLTALPQVLVLAGVAGVIASGATAAPQPALWFALFAVAFGAAACVAWPQLRPGADATQGLAAAKGAAVAPVASPAAAGWRDLGHHGSAAWLTAALATAAILGSQRWVEASAGRAALGQFTVAMTLVQVPLTPVGYAAPLLLRRWMQRPAAQAARRGAGTLFALLLGAAALVWALAPAWPDLGLGPAYAGTTRALAVLLAGAAAEAASRVLTVQASASGLPWVGVRAEVARWGVLAFGWALPLPGGLLPLCAVWSVAAGAAALVFIAHAPVALQADR